MEELKKPARPSTRELAIVLCYTLLQCKMSIFKKKGSQINAANVHMTEVSIGTSKSSICNEGNLHVCWL